MARTKAADTGMRRLTPEEIVPDGDAPPEDIPPEIFRRALETFLDLRRLDMRQLALELGIGRATLYRKVGDRDTLLGAVVWYMTRRAIIVALRGTSREEGAPRIVAVVEQFLLAVHDRPALRRFLEEEPEAALRLLTSKRGPVHAGIVAALERLLDDEASNAGLLLSIDHPTLAYVIVRIGESFLYADVIASAEPDPERAIDVVARLLAGSEVPVLHPELRPRSKKTASTRAQQARLTSSTRSTSRREGRNLAAVDVRTPVAASWRPRIDGAVDALALSVRPHTLGETSATRQSEASLTAISPGASVAQMPDGAWTAQ